MYVNGILTVEGVITGITTTQTPLDTSTKLASTKYVDDAVTAGSGSTPHALLDGVQNNDTVAQSPTRGSLILANATPKWDELVIGGASTLLKSDGTDASWGTVSLLSAFHGDTLAGTVVRGDLIYGNSTPKWARKAVGGANTILNSDGTDFAWTPTPTVDLLYYFGRIIPASIAGNTNDYAPIDSGTSQSFHVVKHISVAATGVFNVTGFDEGTTGESHVFTNRGTNTITFTHNDAASSVNNRIWCPSGVSYAVTAKASVYIYYSQPDNKWVVVDSAAGGITALTGDVTASGSGSVAATIANSAVTLAKIANAAASSKLLGSGSSGSGAAYSEITLDGSLSMSGTTLSVASSAAASVFMTRTVITDAQTKTLNSAPITIVAAPASNQFIMPISMVTYGDRTAGGYSASHATYNVWWNGLTDALFTQQSLNMATAEKRWSRWAAASTLANTNDPHGKAVVLKDNTADITGGNVANYLVVEITYIVVTDGP